MFRVKIFKKFRFRLKISKITISANIFENFWSRSIILKVSISVKILKNIDFGQKSQFPSKFRKIWISFKDFENLDFGQNFGKKFDFGKKKIKNFD